jgi:hypothetical protein
MTIQDHHIDKKARDSFPEYQVPPPAGAWIRLEETLLLQKRARVVLIRRRILGIAAVLIAFFAGYWIALIQFDTKTPMGIPEGDIQVAHLPTETTPQTEGVDLPDKFSKNTVGSEAPSSTQSSGTGMSANALSDGGKTAVPSKPQRHSDGNSISKRNPQKLQLQHEHPIEITWLELPMVDETYTLDVEGIPPRPVSLYAYTGKRNNGLYPDPQPSVLQNRWSIIGLAGQTYGNYYNTNSIAASETYQHDIVSTSREQITKPQVSYGLTLEYRISKPFGIGSGIALHQFATPLNQTSNEIALLSIVKPLTSDFGSVQYTESIRNDLNKSPSLEIQSAYFEQQLAYLEVPLVAIFQLLDRRIGLSVKTGISTNFLTINRVMLVEDGAKSEMGSTQGIRSTVFNGIMSADLSFAITPKLQASFAPVYRHALQAASTESQQSPHIFSLGLYSGLKYRF